MDNEPEVIRQQMAETRASLTEKIETLEEQVAGTVQGATAAVSDTVENVKDAVQETVATVKDAVQDTVEGVKKTFNLPRQVERHPWLVIGASAALGYFSGCLLKRSARRIHESGTHRPSPPEGSDRPESQRLEMRSWQEERPISASLARAFEHAGTRQSWSDRFAPEVAKIKGMAIGYVVGAVRDLISESLPLAMREQANETMDSIAQKLGGQPVHGPVLRSARPEESAARGRRTDVPSRW